MPKTSIVTSLLRFYQINGSIVPSLYNKFLVFRGMYIDKNTNIIPMNPPYTTQVQIYHISSVRMSEKKATSWKNVAALNLEEAMRRHQIKTASNRDEKLLIIGTMQKVALLFLINPTSTRIWLNAIKTSLKTIIASISPQKQNKTK